MYCKKFPTISICIFLVCLITLASSKPSPLPEIRPYEPARRICLEKVEYCEKNGIVPVNITNSRYRIKSDNRLCCPPLLEDCDGMSYCLPENYMEDYCGERGLVREPCDHCWTCAKVRGEICGGTQKMHGKCGDGLECFYRDGKRKDITSQDNSTGICISNETRIKTFGESCGGSYGSVGICEEGLRCSAEERDFLAGHEIRGTCFYNTSAGACFKDCTSRNISPLCGSDGVWYRNLCSLKFQNCWEQLPKIKRMAISHCMGGYTEPTAPPTTTAPSLEDHTDDEQAETTEGEEKEVDHEEFTAAETMMEEDDEGMSSKEPDENGI